MRATPWGLQGRYCCSHDNDNDNDNDEREEDIWLPTFFPELSEDHNHDGPGLHMDRLFRGRWIRDRKVLEASAFTEGKPWQEWGWRRPLRSQGEPPEPLVLPQNYVMQAYPLGHQDIVSAPELDMADVPDVTTRARMPYPRGRGMLNKLPVEVLEMIIEYLVPTGCTYSFFMAETRDIHSDSESKQRSIRYVVNQMVPLWTPKELDEQLLGKDSTVEYTDEMDFPDAVGEGEDQKAQVVNRKRLRDERRKKAIQRGSAHMALACINTTFQHLIYTRFYGRNTFLFTLSGYPFTPLRIEARDLDTRWLSWTRVLTRSVCPGADVFDRTKVRPPGDGGALGFITARAAAYMTDVKLCVITPLEEAADVVAMAHVGQVVDSAVSLLVGPLPSPPTDSTASLSLDVQEEGKRRRRPQLNVSLHLQLSCLITSPSEHFVTLQAGYNRITGKIDIGPGMWSDTEGPWGVEPWLAEDELGLMMQPLRKLRGLVKEMCVHGFEVPVEFLDDVGLVGVDKEEPPRVRCYTFHYSNVCNCITEGGARECPQQRPMSGVATPRWDLEDLGWMFFRAGEEGGGEK